MKFNFLVFFLVASYISNSYGYEYRGGIAKEFASQTEVNSMENLTHYYQRSSDYSTVSSYIDGLELCASRNEYYMPGVTGSDADGCFDVLGYIRNSAPSGEEATFAGVMSAGADLYYWSAADSRPRMGKGQFLADSLCAIDYPGSRAMRYDDLKYLIKKDQVYTSASDDKAFIFDSLKYVIDDGSSYDGIFETERYVAHTGIDWTCNNYSDRSAAQSFPPALNNKAGVAKIVGTGRCDLERHVICVTD